MTRYTFHSRMTIGTLCGIILLAVATLMCFLQRSGIAVACALVLLVLTVAATERALHTEYQITDNGMMTIRKGRFGKATVVDLKETTQIEKIHTTFGFSHFLLIRFSNGRSIIIQPDNEDALISQIHKHRRA